jgi:PAS domain S-box-containing protein
MRAYIRSLLTDAWDVVAVGNGEEALTAAIDHPPDLILSDVMMPKLDGFGLIARLRENQRTRQVPVLLLSARSGEESRIEGLRAGADDYLVKPFSAKELLARIQTHLQIGRFKAAAERERAKLSAVFAQAPVGIALLEGPEHVFAMANPVYFSLLFGEPRDFVGKPVREAVPESVSQGFVALLDRVYSTGEPFVGDEMPLDLIQKDGTFQRFYLNFVYQPLRDADDRVHGIVAVIHDVTERVLSRVVIEQSESRYRTLAESLPQLVWTCSADGRCDYLSQQWVDYTGMAEDDQPDFGWLNHAVHPDDRDRIHTHWLGAVRGEHGYDIEFRIRRHDGAYRWFKTRATPLQDSAGRIASWFGTCTDIQDRKEAEARVIFERNQLETIFQRSPAAMALWVGPDLVFGKVNPRYQAIFPDRQLQGRPFLDACPEFRDQAFPGLVQHVLKTGEDFVGREVLARHADSVDGPPVDHYYDFSYLRINDSDGNPYGVYDHAIDVTDRVRDRRSLEESKQRLERMVTDLEQERDLRDQFVSMLSHDLRSPLQAAKMSAHLICRTVGDSEVAQKFGGRIIENISRADEMIRNLLDANRLKAGERLAIEFERCDLNGVAADTLADLTTLHGDRFILRADSSIEGYWGRGELRRVFENLCGNAVKYGAPHRPVRVTLLRHDDRVTIEVQNEGKPITASDQVKLFQPFKRIEGADPAGPTVGWGLGLTLVKGIVEAHGGYVTVRSDPGTGTLFLATLPLDSRGPPLKPP